MRVLVWAGMFMLLTFAGSTIAVAGMVGMPIAGEVQFGLYTMAALVIGSGAILLIAARGAPPLVSALGTRT